MAGNRHSAIGMWIPLMDYAMKKGISLSTLRRHIKANKLVHKIEDGKYLLWDEDPESSPDSKQSFPESPQSAPLETRVFELTQDLKKAQEEIAELKTLIALYEENIPQHRTTNT